MPKNIIVSNRLPVQITIDESKISLKGSVGGLATGMKSVHKDGNSIWIGWSGLKEEDLNTKMSLNVSKELQKEKCVPGDGGSLCVMLCDAYNIYNIYIYIYMRNVNFGDDGR